VESFCKLFEKHYYNINTIIPWLIKYYYNTSNKYKFWTLININFDLAKTVKYGGVKSKPFADKRKSLILNFWGRKGERETDRQREREKERKRQRKRKRKGKRKRKRKRKRKWSWERDKEKNREREEKNKPIIKTLAMPTSIVYKFSVNNSEFII
jgi:hypothetical protein